MTIRSGRAGGALNLETVLEAVLETVLHPKGN